jgi:hypothetical protein
MKHILFYIGLLLAVGFLSCSKNIEDEELINLRNPGIIIGSWEEVGLKVFKDKDGNLDTIKKAVISFKEDSSYTIQNPLFWMGFNDGKWQYDQATNKIVFTENVHTINGIHVLNSADWNINRTWDILVLNNAKMTIVEHMLRESKIVLNPITNKNDTIQAIDLTVVRNLVRFE